MLALAGCDLLTISPKLLAELDNMSQDAPKKFVLLFYSISFHAVSRHHILSCPDLLIDLSRLSVEMAQGTDSTKLHLDEAGFR